MLPFGDRVKAAEAALLHAVDQWGIAMSGDGRVAERDAARLLGLSAEYLKQMRDEGKSPPSYRRGVAGSRVSYRLDDLALWIEEALDR